MSNKPHVHAELIKAWADGAEIQYKNLTGGEWITFSKTESPCWDPLRCYRIKPQPKPDRRVTYFPAPGCGLGPNLPNLIATFDGETGALKSAEVIK